MGGEGVEGGGEAVDGGVDASGEQGAHHQGCLGVREVAAVGGGPDTGAETVLAQRLAGALGVHPGRQLGRPGSVGLHEVVGRSEGVEGHVAVRQKVVPSLGPQSDGVREHT